MIEQLNKVLSKEVEEVLKSPDLLLTMLRLYSVLYLNGEQVRACDKCHRNYYLELKKDGMERAEIQDKIKARTCVPAWEGRMYSTKIFSFIMPNFMHDELAITYLKSGVLRESDFKVLPKGYKDAADEKQEPINEVEETEQAINEPKKRGPKPKYK